MDGRLVVETAYIGPFADGEDHTFFLPMARIIAAEREMDASIFELFPALGSSLASIAAEAILVAPSSATLKQCHALIRNALIGGGIDEGEAKSLVDVYCFPARPAIKDMTLAFKILEAAVYGVQVKKKDESAAPDASGSSTRAPSSSTARSSGSTGKRRRSAPTSKRAKPGTAGSKEASRKPGSRATD